MAIFGGSQGGIDGVRRYVKKNGIRYRVFHDAKSKTGKALGVKAYPAGFLLNKDGVVVWEGAFHSGGRPEVEELIRRQLAPPDWTTLDAILRVKGKLNADGSYKATILRTKPEIDGGLGFTVPPAQGLNSYAAFTGTLDDATTMGDTCVLAHEVQPTIDALRKGGVEVVALHNHMLEDKPRLFFLHFQGRGPARALAQTIRTAWDRLGAPHPEPEDLTSGNAPTLDVEGMAAILKRPASRSTDGVVKFSLPRSDLTVKLDGQRLLPGMGIGCWAAFYACPCGRTMVKGDTCVTRGELQGALDALRKGGIAISAIHNHLLGEKTQVVFMHFEGEGEALPLARTIRATWDSLDNK